MFGIISLLKFVNALAPAVAPPNNAARLLDPSDNAPANVSRLNDVCVAIFCTSNNPPPKSIPASLRFLNESILMSIKLTNDCTAPPSIGPSKGIVLISPVTCCEKSLSLFPPINNSLPNAPIEAPALVSPPISIPPTLEAMLPNFLSAPVVSFPASPRPFVASVVCFVAFTWALLAPIMPLALAPSKAP